MLTKVFSTVLLQYFRLLAKIQLGKIRPTIIGITGSAGKTSTLHAVHAVLKPHFSTKASYKANSESGLPLNILGLYAEHFTKKEWLKLALLAPIKLLTNWQSYKIYIAEMGIDGPFAPKNMAYLLTIFKPHVGIFLNARPMHSQGFDAVISPKSEAERKQLVTQAIAQEKGKLISALPKNGLAVLNADDPNVVAFAKKTVAAVALFGGKRETQHHHDTAVLSDIQVELTSASTHGSTFTCFFQSQSTDVQKTASEYLAEHTCSFERFALPAHIGHSFAAALTVARYFGIPAAKACKNLEQYFELPPGRASLIPAINSSMILDSSYNSSAQAAIDMLVLLETIAPKRKLALLGDIRELGAVAQEEHELVAEKAAAVCDTIILVGPQMKKYALPVLQKANKTVSWHENAYTAADYLRTVIKKDDTVLVKGSQNTLLLEIAVEKLMTDPTQSEKLLCRRGTFWDKQRAALRHSP